MARNHAKIFTTIWDDPDWVALTAGAQRVYTLLLSQRKLSLVGLLDYLPSRWARLAADTTLDTIEGHIHDLETSRHVIVDHDTDELLIRTFVRHEATSILTNSNLVKGVWSAWQRIESRQLRLVAVENIPASVWDSKRARPPAEALNLRSQLLQNPTSLPLEPSVTTNGSDQPFEPSVETIPEPGAQTPEPEARTDVTSAAANQANTTRRLSTAERQRRLNHAIDLLTDRHLAKHPTRDNPIRHRNAVRHGKLTDHRDHAHQLLADHPDLTPQQLADLLEPAPTNGQQPARTHPAPPPVEAVVADWNTTDPDPHAAQRAAALRQQHRLPGATT